MALFLPVLVSSYCVDYSHGWMCAASVDFKLRKDKAQQEHAERPETAIMSFSAAHPVQKQVDMPSRI
jgi:hypothetical protein